MSRTLDMMTDTFPHGHPDGYRQGCHGGPAACPAPLACRDVFRRYSGDLEFKRAIDAGEPLESILARDEAERDGVLARDKAARRAARQEEQAAHVGGSTPKETTMTTQTRDVDDGVDQSPAQPGKPKRTPKPKGFETYKKGTRKPKPKRPAAATGPTPSEVRAWAHAAGVPVNPKGPVRKDVLEAYNAAHAAPAIPEDGEVLVPIEGTARNAEIMAEAEARLTGEPTVDLVADVTGPGALPEHDPADPGPHESTALPAEEFSEALDQTRQRVSADERAELFEVLADHYKDERSSLEQTVGFLLAKWGTATDRLAEVTAERDRALEQVQQARDIMRAGDDDLATAHRAADRLKAEIAELRAALEQARSPWWKRTRS